METEELIRALAADPRLNPPRAVPRLAFGALASLLLVAAVLGPRDDLGAVLAAPSGWAKLAYPLVLAALFAACWPNRPRLPPRAVLAVVAAGAAVAWLASLRGHGGPAATLAAVRGETLAFCLVAISTLAIPPGLAAFTALRRCVVPEPARAGGMAGLLAGAVAATTYALHCTEDAPAFWVIWYGCGIAIAGLVGRRLGGRWLGV